MARTKGTPRYKGPGKQEIGAWFDAYCLRAGSLVKLEDLNPDKLLTLVCSNLGWHWDLNNVGFAPCRHTGEPSAIQGYLVFLGSLLDKKKKATSR